MKIGIMGAMPEEVSLLFKHMSGTVTATRGMRDYVGGRLRNHDATVVFSRWGKVAASSTATTLIERFEVECLIFTGVAGALDASLNIGDIVVADTLVQHDMDASALPGIERCEIPLLGIAHLPADPRLAAHAREAARTYLREDLLRDVDPRLLERFHIASPRVVGGAVASGDQFIADPETAQGLLAAMPELACVEMEGAAVAQVAYEHEIPFVVIRTISDKANHGAVVDFPTFLADVAAHFTCGAVLRLLDAIA